MNKTCALQPFHGSPPLPRVELTATVSRHRQGMKEETAFTSLLLAIHRQSDSLSLNLKADLGQINQADRAVEIAISAVIQGRDGHTSFWALAHRGPQADFHRRDSFVVEL